MTINGKFLPIILGLLLGTGYVTSFRLGGV